MRVLAGVAAGVVAIAVLLGLPAPKRPAPAAAPAGPPTVASVWPRARPFPTPRPTAIGMPANSGVYMAEATLTSVKSAQPRAAAETIWMMRATTMPMVSSKPMALG